MPNSKERFMYLIRITTPLLLLLVCVSASAQDAEFKGKIGKTLKDSEEY